MNCVASDPPDVYRSVPQGHDQLRLEATSDRDGAIGLSIGEQSVEHRSGSRTGRDECYHSIDALRVEHDDVPPADCASRIAHQTRLDLSTLSHGT